MTQPKAHGRGFLTDGGELGQLINAFDWSPTPIGPIETWPAPMKAIVGFILRSDTPIVTLWGDRGVMIYNDAYRGFAGGRHPGLLGANVLEGWHEVAAFNANVLEKVYRGGGTLTFTDQELILERDGTPRQLWANLQYSPALDEDGNPLGVVAIVLETTDRVLATEALADERRRLLQMAENTPSFMALLEGPDHQITMTNQRYRQLVGDREVLGKTVAEALPDAVAQGFLELLDRVFQSGEPVALEGANTLCRRVQAGRLRNVMSILFISRSQVLKVSLPVFSLTGSTSLTVRVLRARCCVSAIQDLRADYAEPHLDGAAGR